MSLKQYPSNCNAYKFLGAVYNLEIKLLPKKPKAFGHNDSNIILFYSCQHFHSWSTDYLAIIFNIQDAPLP